MEYRSYRKLVQCVLFAGMLASAGCTLQTDKPAAAAPAIAPATQPIAKAAQRLPVSGKVILAADGKPLPNTSVYLVMTREQGITQQLLAKGMTDANGQFRFPDALTWDPNNKKNDRSLAQRYYVLANSPEHGFSFAVILQGDRTDNVTVTLVKPLISAIKVVDGNGKPLPGATVMYAGGGVTEKDAPDWDNDHRWSGFQHGLDVISGTTDANGEIRLDGLYDGSYYIAHKAGYIKSGGNAAGTGTITLMQGTRLAGTVTYEDGTPAPAAKVKCTYRDDKTYWNEQAITDAAGRYVLDGVPASPPADPNSPFIVQTPIVVTIEDPRPDSTYLAKATTCPSVGAEAHLDVQFQKACMLAGKVVDERTGKPLPGIQLQVLYLAEGQQVFDDRPLTSNDKGEFKATVPPGNRVIVQWQDSRSGDYVIDREWLDQQPDSSRYQPFQTEKMTGDKTDLVLKLRLWDIQPLTGVVVDTSGKPLANVSIHLNTNVQPVKTAADGTFTLKCAPKDRDFELCAISKDKAQACLVKLPKATAQTTLQLKPTAAREGFVKTPSGMPANNLKFYLDLELNGQSHYLIREEPQTDAKGAFIANNLIPGARYNIFWSADNDTNRDYDYGNAKIDLASLKDGEPIQFSAKKYVNALMGQVVGPDGKPVAGATIILPQTSDLLPQDKRMSNTQIISDKDGNFTIERLADGEVTLKVSAAGLKPGTVRTNTDNIELKVALRPITDPTIYRAKVIDAQGKPIEGVSVTMMAMQVDRQGKRGLGTTAMKTDPAGIASFAGPATAPSTQPVQYSQTVMLCDADGYDIASSPSMQMGEDIDVQLTLAKSDKHWQGKVVDDKGSPITGAKIRIEGYRQDDGGYVSLGNFGETPLASMAYVTDPEGRFTVSRLGRGCWANLSIASPGMKTLRAYFEPRQDSGADCKTFTMVKGAGLKGKVVLKATGMPVTPQDGTASHVVIQKTNGEYGAASQLKPDGTFSTNELDAGIYSVKFTSADLTLRKYVLRNAPTVTTKSGETADLTLELEEGIPFKGKLTNLPTDLLANTPQNQIGSVIAARGGERNYTAYGMIDKEGEWVIYLPDNGKYTIKYIIYSAAPGGRATDQPAGIIEVKDNKAPADMTIEYKPAK